MKYELGKDVGIDYGMTRTNVGQDGYRFGVIGTSAVPGWWDDCEPQYDVDFEDENAALDCELEAALDCEPVGFVLKNEDYCASSNDHGDIFIEKSPYYTYAQFCSPCVPGAIHLDHPVGPQDSSPQGNCFGHDMFEDGIALYPVWSKATLRRVWPHEMFIVQDVKGQEIGGASTYDEADEIASRRDAMICLVVDGEIKDKWQAL